VLGVIGGLSSIIWALLSIFLGSYETFKLENSLIGSVYSTGSKEADEDSGAPESEQ